MLIALLARIAAEQRADWNVLRRVLNVIAVVRSHGGEYWDVIARRLHRAGVQRVRSVSVSDRLWDYFADNRLALAASHHEARWSDPRAASPVHTQETASHIRRGYVLHWTARTRAFRERLVRAIARHAPHHSPYLSSLMHTLRCAPRRC
jgi:hypothetical protein